MNMENMKNFRISELDSLFNDKLTENGDNSHKSTGNKLVDYMFQAEYFQKHLNEVKIGDSYAEKLFSMFIRDPRNGMKYRDLGRELMYQSKVSPEAVAFAGRFDDLWKNPLDKPLKDEWVKYLLSEVVNGNNLAKKWMPHYVGKLSNGKPANSTIMASRMRSLFTQYTGVAINKQQYNQLVKVDTVESKLSAKDYDAIDFSKLPSLALLKYWSRFAGNGKNYDKKDMAERFQAYLESVKKGESKMNLSVATVYDIYRKSKDIDADLAFSQLKKVSGNWLPVLDSSGSMFDTSDSIGKACSVAHYLAKTSTYCPNKVISFGRNPKLIDITVDADNSIGTRWDNENKARLATYSLNSEYAKEINRMHVGFDGNNTDMAKTFRLISTLKSEFPEYIVVLSDMEFDVEGASSAEELTDEWRRQGINTKLVWWNFNGRNRTSPQAIQTDCNGNIFMSGYDPSLLRFLEAGFDAETFLVKLLQEYASILPENLSID